MDTLDLVEARIAELMAKAARAERAEAALAEMTQLHKDRQDDLAFEYERANRAEAALTAMIERKEYFRQCWEVAEAALAEVQNRTCLWRWHDEHGWCATCGGGGIDKWERFGKTYCPSCGAKIVEPHEIAP